MATYGPIFTKSYPAADDLSSYQYRFVLQETDGQVNIAADATAAIKGILQDDPDDEDKGASVAWLGFSKLEVNGNSSNIAVGSKLTATTGGIGIKTTTDKEYYGAIAEEASIADGDIICVQIMSGARVINSSAT